MMSRRNSLSRFSFSASNISSPLAESTKIGSPRESEFEIRGASKFFPREQPAGGERTYPSAIPRSISSVDPKTYTDVQSRGLVSRIIKYHDDNKKLNRSLSSSSLYNKPGEFPIVHLKRNELRYYPKRNQLISGTRIAPPDKSVFQTNTRSSIFRSGAIISHVPDKIDGRGFRENEPILPLEDDGSLARSSLNALKEISRKRINSDDLDGNDGFKKYRKEYIYAPFSSKRQRECQVSPKSQNDGNVEQAVKKRICTKNNDILSSLSSSLHINSPKRKICDTHPLVVETNPSSIRKSPVPPKAKQPCHESNYIRPPYPVKSSLDEKPPEQKVVEPKSTQVRPQVTKKLSQSVVSTSHKPKITLFNANYNPSQKPSVVENNLEKQTNGVASEEEEDDTAGISFVKPKNNKISLQSSRAAMERQKKSKLQMMLNYLNGDLPDEGVDEVDKIDKTSKVDTKNAEKTSIQPAFDPQKNKSTASGFTLNATVSDSHSNALTTSAAVTTTTSINNKPIMSNQTTTSSKGFTFGTTSTSASKDIPTPTTVTTSAPAPVPSVGSGFVFGNNTASDATSKASPKNSITSQTTTTSADATAPFSFGLMTKSKDSVSAPKASDPVFSATTNPGVTTNLTFAATTVSTGTSTTQSSDTSKNTGFTFGPTNAVLTNSQLSFKTSEPISTVTTTLPNGDFNFGSNLTSQSTSTSATNTFTLPKSTVSFNPVSQQQTQLNQDKTTTSNDTTTTFTLPTNPPNPWSTSTPAKPIFGSSEQKAQATVAPFGGTTSASTNTFGNTTFSALNKQPEVTTFDLPKSILGNETNPKSNAQFSFNANKTTNVEKKETTTNLFSNSNNTGFAFNNNMFANNNQKPTTTATPPAPSFGFVGNSISTTASTTTNNPGTFAFGTPTTSSNANPNPNQPVSAFTFGGASKTEANNNSGNNTNTDQNLFLFGTKKVEDNNSTTASNSNRKFNFLNPASKSVFGGGSASDSNQNFNFGQSNATSSGANMPISFKPVPDPSSSNNVANTSFNTTFNAGSAADGKSLFGGASNNNSVKTQPFAFGATNNENKNAPQTVQNLFSNAPAAEAAKSFNFTGNTFAPQPANVFGAAPTFNNNSNSTSLFGGANANNPPQDFSLSGNTSKPQQNTAPPFAFGATTSIGNQEKENKPFTFGSQNSGQQSSTPSPFGGPSLGKPPDNTFGHTGPTPNPFGPPTMAAVNPFTPGPSTAAGGSLQTNSRGRAIRIPTRRLKER